jgi:hypothetical protein
LRGGGLTEIKRMETEFESNGWCFVFLPTKLVQKSNLTKKLLRFFKYEEEKDKYSQAQAIQHDPVDFDSFAQFAVFIQNLGYFLF